MLSPACSSTSISLWSLWGQCEASAARMNRMKLHLTTKFLREIDSWGFGWRQSTLAANKYFHVQSPKGLMLLPPNQTPFSRFVCAIVSERKYRVLVRKPNHNHRHERIFWNSPLSYIYSQTFHGSTGLPRVNLHKYGMVPTATKQSNSMNAFSYLRSEIYSLPCFLIFLVGLLFLFVCRQEL